MTKNWLVRSESWLAGIATIGAFLPALLPGKTAVSLLFSTALALVTIVVHVLQRTDVAALKSGPRTVAFWAALGVMGASIAASVLDAQIPGIPAAVTKYAGLTLAVLTALGYNAIRVSAKNGAPLVELPKSGGAAVLMLALGVSVTLQPGCATVSPYLPTALVYLQDASLVVGTIEAFVHSYFILHPDSAKEFEVDQAIAKTRTALDIATRSIHGAQKLDQAQIDLAFADFKEAYSELVALAGPLGVTSTEEPIAVGALNKVLPPDMLFVPSPLAIAKRR